jgi:hypothetical protein
VYSMSSSMVIFLVIIFDLTDLCSCGDVCRGICDDLFDLMLGMQDTSKAGATRQI